MLLLAKLTAALAALGLGLNARDPVLAGYRPWPLVASVVLALIVLVAIWRGMRHRHDHNIHGQALLSVAGIALFTLLVAIVGEGRVIVDRERVLNADAQVLQRVGRHVIAGYRDVAEIRALAERGAIGGVFVTTHNVRGRSFEEVRDEIGALQTVRRDRGLPPLWIATDQEGGLVSRLSPPLPRLPSLGGLIREIGEPRARAQAVERFAKEQGRGLADLGVTINFAPVVDVAPSATVGDGMTRLQDRAISDDAEIIAGVATRYCAGLADAGVLCTLKHFPGLGRAKGDTHRAEVRLEAPLADLDGSDWVPFRRVSPLASTVIMVGHARLMAVDADAPASVSRKVIGDIVRGRLGHEGLVVTDDLCMAPILGGRGGVGGGALAALNAGADLVLVSWDPSLVYPVLATLIAGDKDGRLEKGAIERSVRRLELSRENRRRTDLN